MANVQHFVYQQFGIKLKLIGAPNGENIYVGACPFCPDHGVDRFTAWERGNYFCRHCGKGWLSSPQEWRPEDLKTIEKDETLQAERFNAWINSGIESRLKQWHDSMPAPDEEYWFSAGIPKSSIDLYILGFCPDHSIKQNGEIQHVESYTIPIRSLENGQLVNVQYRIKNLQKGKYRQVFGIPAKPFFAGKQTVGDLVIVEGAKKAICVYNLIQGGMQVVGLPSNVPSPHLIHQLDAFQQVWIVLDPGSMEQSNKIARTLTHRRFIVSMPVKPDDAINEYGMTKESFWRDYLKFSRRWEQG